VEGDKDLDLVVLPAFTTNDNTPRIFLTAPPPVTDGFNLPDFLGSALEFDDGLILVPCLKQFLIFAGDDEGVDGFDEGGDGAGVGIAGEIV
jgi:hypothetical protein